jgi:WD40 repeat protein
VQTVAFSPDGGTLATGGDDQTVIFWGPETGKPHAPPRRVGSVFDLAFSADGKLLAVAIGYGGLQVYDFAAPAAVRPRAKDALPGEMLAILAFAPKDRVLAGASFVKSGFCWDLDRDLKQARQTKLAQAMCVTFAPTGRQLALGSTDGTLQLWDLETGAVRKLTGTGGAVNAVAFTPDGGTLAWGGNWNGTIRLRHLASGHTQTIRTGCAGGVRSLAFSPDGRLLVAGHLGCGAVRVWDVIADPEAQAFPPLQPPAK